MRAPEFRLRAPTLGLVGLSWDRPLEEWNVPEEEWNAPEVPLRDIRRRPRLAVKMAIAEVPTALLEVLRGD